MRLCAAACACAALACSAAEGRGKEQLHAAAANPPSAAAPARQLSQRGHGPQVALTFDDLPLHGPIPEGDSPQGVANGVIAALTRARVPAYGFVNAHWVSEQPDTLQVLAAWRAAGLALGNHGWSHQHLGEMSLAQFEQEVARGEPLLRQLSGSSDWRWLRYPFLDEGKDPLQRQAARDILARRGYKIADVTMDFGDWQWSAPYARCRAAHDRRSIAKLKQLYVSAAREAIAYYRALSHQLLGRDIPYVILLHESAFEAHMLPRLIALFRSNGFSFVTLPAAESDPYYASRIRPRLQAEPPGLVGLAIAHGVRLPPRTELGPELAALCPAPAPTSAGR